MPRVQIHDQRHLLRPKNRCEGIAQGSQSPGARSDQPGRRRKTSLPHRVNGVHRICGIAGKVGECGEGGKQIFKELTAPGL